MNLWLCITIFPVVCYSARIFTRFFIGRLNPAGKHQSFPAPALLLPKRAERKVENEMVEWLQNQANVSWIYHQRAYG